LSDSEGEEEMGEDTPPVMTPAMLMQKEHQIQKMKEMIALMEQNRSMKLAKTVSTGLEMRMDPEEACDESNGSDLFSAVSYTSPLRLYPLLGRGVVGDVGRRICQYEIPGGGWCRDEECEDVHLRVN